MTTRNQLSARLAVETAVDLHRVAEHFIVAMVARLRQLEADLVATILRRDTKHLDSLLAETQALIRQAFSELADRLEDDTDELLVAVEERERRNWLLVFGLPVPAGALALPTGATLLVAGATGRSWLARQGADLSFRFSAITRLAFAGGTPDLDALADKVRGQTPESPVPVTAQTERAVKTTVRTTAETVGTVVREKVAEAATVEPPVEPEKKPPTVIRYGWQQISILDARTTTICLAYAFKIWNAAFEPLGHRLPYNGGPPRHPNCRSVMAIIILDDDPLKEMTFREWMDTLTADEQNRIFGPTRMKLWRDGKITDSDLIDQQHRALTLAQFNDTQGNE